MRYFIEVAYNGTAYHGWQTQPNARTVQEVLDAGLRTLLRQKIESSGSGRTDTGVHARQQFAHFEVNQEFKPALLLHKLNRMLPPDISVQNIYPVGPEAHARFDAVSRTYEYHLSLQKNPFRQQFTHLLNYKVDINILNEAAALLLTVEDFTTFSKVKGDTLHYRCKIYQANWRYEDDLLIFTIQANRFLRGMVRLVVGTLLEVGKGKISLAQFKNILLAQNRKGASGAAPATGLYLTKVTYPDNYFESEAQKFYTATTTTPEIS